MSTAIVLLVAGYDTTGNTLAFALYELAKNPEVQEKLRTEVEDITDGDLEKELTYDDLQKMTYLDQGGSQVKYKIPKIYFLGFFDDFFKVGVLKH